LSHHRRGSKTSGPGPCWGPRDIGHVGISAGPSRHDDTEEPQVVRPSRSISRTTEQGGTSSPPDPRSCHPRAIRGGRVRSRAVNHGQAALITCMGDRAQGRQQQRQQHGRIVAVGGERPCPEAPRSQTPMNAAELRKQSLKTGVTGPRGPETALRCPRSRRRKRLQPAAPPQAACQRARWSPRAGLALHASWCPDADRSESRSSAGACWQSSARVGSSPDPYRTKPARGLPGGLLVLVESRAPASRYPKFGAGHEDIRLGFTEAVRRQATKPGPSGTDPQSARE
jgi:hypothetical protein